MCDAHARHLAPAIDEMRYHPVFNNIYGGVIALSVANYQLINGFGNRYAGWGNEDDDMSARTIGAGMYDMMVHCYMIVMSCHRCVVHRFCPISLLRL